MNQLVFPPRVIPVFAQRKTGTQTREPVRKNLCSWVPVFACRETGMTSVFELPR